ncbi:unnamed protein product [Zymoseptoria tritici ST99CH_1E4]|uniref:Alpha/beta hydrolase fold-3 domain-containing protein n=1 Tax=Zymoseptoria tritici ST99CH_1E4 TaxID=1276532 RepID=A0A2H1FK04_ZYMTR|nr:unnamed protein product [Zymoseptoria tritici ST99CH_1E4]
MGHFRGRNSIVQLTSTPYPLTEGNRCKRNKHPAFFLPSSLTPNQNTYRTVEYFRMADIKNWSSLGEPDAEFLEVAKSIGGAPDLGVFPTIQAMRDFLEQSKAATQDLYGPISGVSQRDHEVEMRDGKKISCIGGLTNEELLCKLLVSKLGMTAVNVDYRLGPEHKFPTAHNDCLDATKWAASNASSLGADPSKGFIIGGTSAGGNITATVSHQWRDEKQSPPLTGSHLMIPAVVAAGHVPEEFAADYKSYGELPNAAILSHKAMDLFADNYCPVEKRSDPIFSPLLWPTGHGGLPPQYFQICGGDPLRDEGLIYERLLREKEGTATKVDVYPGQPHGFWSVFPQMKASQKFIGDSVKGVEWLLQQKKK